MRLHKLLAEAVVENLRAIFSEGKFADKVIASSLKKNSKWGSRDRKFIAESTYEIVRNYRLFFSAAGTKNFWPLLATYFIRNGIELPEWKEFSGISEKRIKNSFQEHLQIFAVAQSIPDWLNELGRNELGETNWEKEMIALNEEAKVVLRVNTLKTNKSSLQQALLKSNIETEIHQTIPEALILKNRQPVFTLPEFKNGFFELQDISSQCVGHFMQLKPGMKVVDACAGGGGKSLHIAAIMENKGKIISMDVRQNKLDELKKRAVRAGAFNIETRIINTSEIKKLENSADRLLLDAPCSGLGVLKRNPDAKWKLNIETIQNVIQTQSQILNDYSSIVKPGGKLIYATCSILSSENKMQINKFLDSNSEFEFEEEKNILPSEGFDGFYICRLKRKA